MSKTIEMDKMAESIASMVIEWVDGGIKMNTDWRTGLANVIQLRLNRLAAPVVERQSVQYPTLASLLADLPDGYSKDDVAFGWNECIDNISPPAPVAVDEQQALQDRHEAWMAGVENGKKSVSLVHSCGLDMHIKCVACLDKVKELNK